MGELRPMFEALRRVGVNPAPLTSPEIAHAVAYGQTVISQHGVPGVDLSAKTINGEIRLSLTVGQGVEIEQPIHLCLGLFEPTGDQNISLHLILEEAASARIYAHCLFTQPLRASHRMQADVRVGCGAKLRYNEVHFHGPSGGIEVRPKANVRLAPGSRLWSDFSLVVGLVGRLDIDYDVDVAENAVAELTSKVYGRGKDWIRIRERVVLSGPNARGLVKSRIAAADDAMAEIIGITEGNAPGARGHVDCLEIVRDRAQVSANPQVSVRHPDAKVTHEAAIGSVDHQQLETLMARGLSPDTAVDLIVSGLLRQG